MLGNDIIDHAAEPMQVDPRIQTEAPGKLDDASREIPTPVLANDARPNETERFVILYYHT